MKPELFLARHSVFTRKELAEVLLRRGRSDSTIDAHLARWLRQGRIKRVKQGVYYRVDEEFGDSPTGPDLMALASRMAPDAAIAYHSALEFHGFARSLFDRLTFVTWTKAKPTVFQGRRFVPVRPRSPLRHVDREAWIERGERAGVEVRVTDLERTVVDVLDRIDLAGGVEEVWRSIESIPAFDLQSLARYAAALGGKTLAAKLGFFLETRREELVVPEKLLEDIRSRIPRVPVFMDRWRGGTLVAQWNLIVPPDVYPERSAGLR